MDPQQRIKELEAQVSLLQDQIQALTPVHPAHPAHEVHIAPSPLWRWGDVWLGRGVAVFVVAVAMAATLLSLRGESLSFAQALSLGREVATIPIDYRLLVCSAVTLLAVLSYLIRQRSLFIGLGLGAVYLTYLLCLSTALGDAFHPWFPFGFLSVVYLLFSGACILEGRKPGTGRRRRLALLAGANSLIYFFLAWPVVTDFAPGLDWLFRVGFTATLVGFAFLAETSGYRRNYLFQIFAVKAVIFFIFTLEVILPGQRFWMATSLACVALAVAYRFTGVVALKVVNLFLLLITFSGALRAVKTAESFGFFGLTIPENWLIGGVTVAACVFLAWYYEHRVSASQGKSASASGHWFLAGTPLDVPAATASMLHAAAGALLLLTLTILEIGEQQPLPWVLTLEAVALAAFGLMLFTPQIEIASLLLLTGAHVALGFLVFNGVIRLTIPQEIPLYVLLLVSLTYWAANRWEKYLARIRGGGPWEHYIASSVPYVMATILLCVLIHRLFDGAYGPLLHCALGALLFFVGWFLSRPAVKLAGIGAVGYGLILALQRLYGLNLANETAWGIVPYVAIIAAGTLGGERAVRLLERRAGTLSPGDELARALFIFGGMTLGLLSVYLCVDAGSVTLWWGIVPALGILLAVLTRYSRYGWASLAALCCMAGRAFHHDLGDWSNSLRYSLSAVVAVLFIVALWSLRHVFAPSTTPLQRKSESDSRENHA